MFEPQCLIGTDHNFDMLKIESLPYTDDLFNIAINSDKYSIVFVDDVFINQTNIEQIRDWDTSLILTSKASDIMINSGIEYSIDSQGHISGSYGDTIEGSSQSETINSDISGEGGEYLKVA